MKKTVTIILLVSAAFFGLSSCEGSYIDPGAMGMGGGLGFLGGLFGDDDHDYDGDYSGYPGTTPGGNTPGGGSKAATYSVDWWTGWGNNEPILTIVWGSIENSEQDTIEKAMRISDITMTPNDVITLGTITQNGPNMGVDIACTVRKSGTVKITLKTIAGYTFTKASWGEDTITVVR